MTEFDTLHKNNVELQTENRTKQSEVEALQKKVAEQEVIHVELQSQCQALEQKVEMMKHDKKLEESQNKGFENLMGI